MSPKAKKPKKTPSTSSRGRSSDRKPAGRSSGKKSGTAARKTRAAKPAGRAKKTAAGKATRPTAGGKTAKKKMAKSPRKVASRPVAKVKRKAKSGAKRRATRKRSRFAPKELRHYRELLVQKQRELTDAYHLSKGDSRSDLDDGTEDYIDYAVHSYAREFLLSLTEMDRKQLYLVEQALERLDRGGYGNCEQCQKDIHAKRLEVAPWAKYCVPCQELEERGLLPQPEDEEEQPPEDVDDDDIDEGIDDEAGDDAGDEVDETDDDGDDDTDDDDR